MDSWFDVFDRIRNQGQSIKNWSGCKLQYSLKNHMNIDVDVHVLNLLILLMIDGGAMNHGFTASQLGEDTAATPPNDPSVSAKELPSYSAATSYQPQA